MSKLVQGESQEKRIFNLAKRFVKELPNMTNEQLAIIHFEIWDEARKRASSIAELNKGEVA